MSWFEDIWNEKKTSKYKVNEAFELCYLDLMMEKTQDFDVIWEVSTNNYSGSYQFNKTLENEFLKKIEVLGLYDIWDYVSETCSFDEYENERLFEEELCNVAFEKGFDHFSRIQSSIKYKTSSFLEDCYRKVVPNENVKGDDDPIVKKKVPNKKSKESQNLKNLLELRLKRLKAMNDHIDLIKIDDRKAIVFQCKLCHVQSKRKRKLFVSHILPVHIKPNKKNGQRRKNRNKISIKSVIEKQFICTDLHCIKRYATRFARKRHMLTVHYKYYRFECDICQKKFRDNSNLLRHKKLKHKISPLHLKCLLCSYRTIKAFNLERHCETIHAGEGNFGKRGNLECDVCSKSFNTGFRLNKHMGMK